MLNYIDDMKGLFGLGTWDIDPTSPLDRRKASKQTQSNHQGVYNRILAIEVEETFA